ncbi:MAG: hypothetical protein JWO06_2993 [Bacteroidota bacterium]|nr:hypothetical protein [Bacteroidota bacterium]
MKKLYFLFCITLFSSIYSQLQAQCSNGRYYNSIFSSGTSTVTYGRAMEWDSSYIDMKVDVYQPTGDNFAHRPLMIFAFGGSFTSGVRQSPDLITLCTYFAQRGYVCASIDYRLGMDSLGDTPDNEFKALIRGVQDMKAAVRYFYMDAQTTNQFRIDTNQIFIGGVSAGAFIGLNYAYLKQDTLSKPAPSFAIPDIIALGGLDGNSGNPGYSTKVKGCIDLSGAIADTVWIMPGDPILVGEHGTDDHLVACTWDSAYAVINPRSSLFGGCDIKTRLSHITLNNNLYIFEGAGHVPFIIPHDSSIQAILNVIKYMDSTERLIRDFLYPNIVCDSTTIAGISEPEPVLAVSIFPNPANDLVYITSDYPKQLSLSLLNVQGQIMQLHLLSAGSGLALQRNNLSPGVYLLQFADKDNKGILKTEKLVFY